MMVHAVLEAMGVPAAVTLLLVSPPRSRWRGRALAVRLDELMLDRDPSAGPAVRLAGSPPWSALRWPFGGRSRWSTWSPARRRRPTVPVSEGGQPTGDQPADLDVPPGQRPPFTERPGGPNTHPGIGDTMAAAGCRTRKLPLSAERPGRADPDRAAGRGHRRGRGGHARAAGQPPGRGRGCSSDARDADLLGHPQFPCWPLGLRDVVAIIAVSAVGVTDRPGSAGEAKDFGLPTLLVERADRPDLVPM